MKVRSILAPNPGPITLTGTRSHVVGDTVAAIIDPGPGIPSHLDRLAEAVAGARKVVILLTHAHPDHAAGAPALAAATGARILGPGGEDAITDGQRFETSAGTLAALSTPGHAHLHFCFHLEAARAVFVGDLVLGEGDTTWVGEYPGAVADYLDSLDRLDLLRPRILHTAHGPDITDPATAIARFRNHRLARIDRVRRVLADGVTDGSEVVARVYGPLTAQVQAMALASVTAIMDYLHGSK